MLAYNSSPSRFKSDQWIHIRDIGPAGIKRLIRLLIGIEVILILISIGLSIFKPLMTGTMLIGAEIIVLTFIIGFMKWHSDGRDAKHIYIYKPTKNIPTEKIGHFLESMMLTRLWEYQVKKSRTEIRYRILSHSMQFELISTKTSSVIRILIRDAEGLDREFFQEICNVIGKEFDLSNKPIEDF